jgi:predicted regulator of Ras-like GTPase activity (Roadblock/LC7/MglB family)
VTAFRDVLEGVRRRVPETQVLMVLGSDGLPIEKLVVNPGVNQEVMAAEFARLFRASSSASNDTGVGGLTELELRAGGMDVVMRTLTPEYFLFLALSPGALAGRARFALRLAGLALEGEFA